jgi:transcriptional regulator with XRE-family HTH domain
MSIKIGEYVKSLVKERGMSQAEFARRIGKVPASIPLIYERDYIRPDLLKNIADTLVVEYSELVKINSGLNMIEEPVAPYSSKLKELEKEKQSLSEENSRLMRELIKCQNKLLKTIK